MINIEDFFLFRKTTLAYLIEEVSQNSQILLYNLERNRRVRKGENTPVIPTKKGFKKNIFEATKKPSISNTKQWMNLFIQIP